MNFIIQMRWKRTLEISCLFILRRNHTQSYKSQIYLKIHPDLLNKLIHPDITLVKDTNLKCMQTLNVLFDSLDDLNAYIASNDDKTALPILYRQRLLSEYDLTCYARLSDDFRGVFSASTSNNTEVRFVKFSLKTPHILCRSASTSSSCTCTFVSKNDLFSSLQKIQNDLIDYAQLLGVPITPSSSHNQPNSNSTSSKYEKLTPPYKSSASDWDSQQSTLLQQRIDLMMFDRIVYNRHNRTQYNLFGNSSKQKGNLSREVDFYLQHGQIFISNLSVTEEFAVLSKFRDFIISYGEILNFGPTWRSLTFIFYGYSKLQQPTYRDGPSYASVASPMNTARTNDIIRKQEMYRCEFAENKYLLEIPHDFKNKRLIQFLTTHVDDTFDLDITL